MMKNKTQRSKRRQPSKKPIYKRIAYAAAVFVLLVGAVVLSIIIDKSSPVFTLSIENDLTEDAAKQLCQMIEEKPYINNVKYLTKEDVLEQNKDKIEAMIEEEGYDPLNGLNPFLPLIDIRLKTEYAVPDSFPRIEAEMLSLPMVTEVSPPENFQTMQEDMKNLKHRIYFLRGIALLLSIMFIWLCIKIVRSLRAITVED